MKYTIPIKVSRVVEVTVEANSLSEAILLAEYDAWLKNKKCHINGRLMEV